MLRNAPVVKVSHVYREDNRCADWVTKQVQDSGVDLELFDDFLIELVLAAEEDERGVSSERL